MKHLILVAYLILTQITFAQTESNQEYKTFSNPNNSLTIEAPVDWVAAGNMKGIEIFLSNSTPNSSIDNILTVSTTKGFKEEVLLEKFSASKISLQTSVLKAQIESSDEITINDINAKSFVYTYKNEEFETVKTRVVFFTHNNIGYQLTASASTSEFIKLQFEFDHFFSSIVLK